MGFVITHAFNSLNVKNANDFWSNRRGRERYAWVFPSNLQEVKEVFSDELPDIQVLVYAHTRFNLYEPFLSEEEAERLFHYYISGDASLPQGLHTGSRFLSRRAVCPDCIREDIADFGYATWRRVHLAAGIVACAEHGTLLLDLCAACANFRRRASSGWVPKLHCVCGRPRRRIRNPRSIQMDVEIGMAEMAGQLLRGEVLVNLDEWSIPLAIRNYLGSDSVASNVDSLKGILVEELGPEMMNDMSFGEDYITRLVGGDPLESRPKNPMQNIAVAHAVFGSWTVLAEYIPSGNPVLDGERRLGRKKSNLASTPVYKMNKMEFSNHLKGLSEVELQEVIDGNRLWFLETLEILPDITLDDLNRGERNRINQMIDWDRGFIDERLPLAGMMSEVEKKSKQERIDELVARIYFLRDANIRADPCRKIMKSHLVLNGRAVSKSLEIAESEEVMKAFGDCIDTHETHLARVAVHMSYLARKLRPNSLWADESSWSGLSPKNLAARIGTIKKWERTAGQ